MKTETEEQTAVVRWLEARGYVVVRVVAASKAGVADLVACTPDGRFLAVEMKKEVGGVSSGLQKVFLAKVAKNKGLSLVAHGYAHFKRQMATLAH